MAGEAPALYDVSSISDGDLIHIVPIAILAIGLLLALVLRSLIAPLYLIASVMLSYLAALGLASIVFIKLASSGGLTFLLPFLMFIFLLALGEDYNILVMTRIREEAHQQRLRDAVVTAVGGVGADDHLGGTGPGGDLPRARGHRRRPTGRKPDPRHRHRLGARDLDGHVSRAQPARAIDGVVARPVELVAGQAGRDGPGQRVGPRRRGSRQGQRRQTTGGLAAARMTLWSKNACGAPGRAAARSTRIRGRL